MWYIIITLFPVFQRSWRKRIIFESCIYSEKSYDTSKIIFLPFGGTLSHAKFQGQFCYLPPACSACMGSAARGSKVRSDLVKFNGKISIFQNPNFPWSCSHTSLGFAQSLHYSNNSHARLPCPLSLSGWYTAMKAQYPTIGDAAWGTSTPWSCGSSCISTMASRGHCSRWVEENWKFVSVLLQCIFQALW